jgi:hypothetical protein
MKIKRVKIFFHDEAPRIGCGWRLVTVKIGRKWVWVRDAQGGRAVRRFTHDQYARLKPIEL